MNDSITKPKDKSRRWARFGIRMLLGLIVLFSMIFSQLVPRIQQRQNLDRLKKHDASFLVTYDYQQIPDREPGDDVD